MEEVKTLPVDEQILVERALTDAEAFGELYDRYAQRIYTYMRYRVDSIQTAEDLTAKTFEQALINLKNYQPHQGEFSAWLFGIAHHTISRHYRKQRRFQWLSFDQLFHHTTESTSPEEQVIHNETQEHLLQAVQQLKARERNLIALKFAGELNNRQIAEITNLSESNVGVILYRAIKKLRGIMGGSRDNE